MEVAEKGIGEAGWVPIPEDIWDSFATPSALSSMFRVEVPRKTLRSEELAMTKALLRQGHLFVFQQGMPGFGRAPSAPIFILPKTDSKCSFIVNCTLGNWAPIANTVTFRCHQSLLQSLWQVRRGQSGAVLQKRCSLQAWPGTDSPSNVIVGLG